MQWYYLHISLPHSHFISKHKQQPQPACIKMGIYFRVYYCCLAPFWYSVLTFPIKSITKEPVSRYCFITFQKKNHNFLPKGHKTRFFSNLFLLDSAIKFQIASTPIFWDYQVCLSYRDKFWMSYLSPSIIATRTLTAINHYREVTKQNTCVKHWKIVLQ